MALVYIVEDDERIAILLSSAVEAMGLDAARFRNADDLFAGLRRAKPDLLLLDLMLGMNSGYDILDEWKNRKDTSHTPVIIVSALSAEENKVRGLDLGAEDYITKPFGVKELQARVRAALRRAPVSAKAMRFGELTIDEKAREVRLADERIMLSFMEFELLLYLAKRPGYVASRDELLSAVWGYKTQSDPSRTVDYHVRVVRSKLRDNPAQPRYLETIRGFGYRFIGKSGGENE
ncbi:MAG: response regulator transcription factor [Clostridia bacterium]|nr:response regulator transcription factor [Clostridia bacterium]